MTQRDERPTATTVSHRMTMECLVDGGTTHRVATSFGYDPADPYAVTLTFHTAGGEIPWRFARELLVHGLITPTGDGDVHVWPCLDNQARSVVIIELCSPDGEALVQARTVDVTAFVEEMVAAVPQGAEGGYLDVDGAIAAIFAEEAA